MSMKIPAGIEPTTFRFVAQHLDHSATAVPFRNMFFTEIEWNNNDNNNSNSNRPVDLDMSAVEE